VSSRERRRVAGSKSGNLRRLVSENSNDGRRQSRTVRLPLQVGLAGLGQTTRYAALLWLGPILLLASALLLPAFPPLLRLPWVFCSALSGIFVLALTLEAADRAKRDQPSDILLDSDGIRIVRLDEAPRLLSWSALDAGNCNLVSVEPRLALRWLFLSWLTLKQVPALLTRAHVPVFRLRVPRIAGGHIDLAEAEGSERESLEALRDSIRTAYAPAASDSAAELSPDILRCTNCGAPQAPLDRERMPCPFCGQDLVMPKALREKLHALRELEKTDAPNTRAIERLLSQPSARWAARVLWLGRKLLVLVQPAVVVYFGVLLHHQTETVGSSGEYGIQVVRTTPGDDTLLLYDSAILALLLVVVFWVVWATLSAYFANRKALRLLAENFGAVPPTKPGAPSTCRQCGAPLASESNALLVRCAYCGAENVFGVDPRPAAARKRQMSAGLGSAVRARRNARLRLALTLPLSALAAFGIVREAAVIWWVPKVDPDAPNQSWHTHVGVLRNLDGVRRSVVLRDEKGVVHATLLPHGSLFWDCPAGCTLQRGSVRVSADQLASNATLVISRGNLSTAVDGMP